MSFHQVMNQIDKAIESIDLKVYSKLVDHCDQALTNKNKIIVSGLGKNVPVCEKFVGSMVSLGLNASYMNTNTAVHGDLGIVHPEDLVILLTKSGETEESIYLYDLLKKRDCVIWLLTFSENSTLTSKISNSLIISLDHESDPWNLMPINSTTINLIVLQELVMQLSKKRNISLTEFKRNHPGGHIGARLDNE